MEQKSSGVSLAFMVTILNRKYDEQAVRLLAREGVSYQLTALGYGTAGSEILDYLGLGETEKVLLLSILPRALSVTLMEQLDHEFRLSRPGNGIVFTLPIGCVCGSSALRCFTDESKEERKASTGKMSQHDLVIAIANRGYSSEVMEAAKSAKAFGGTILNARGGNLKDVEKFFGVTVQPEKEIILILTEEEVKEGIMQAIASQAGFHTKANTVVFSLPVNGVMGLHNGSED